MTTKKSDFIDSMHNQKVYETVPFNASDQVRILEDKGEFAKGKNKFSKETYTVDKKDGYKIKLNDTTRKFKPSELLKINSIVSNPISQAYIDRNIKAKENAKITTKLIRNEDMTKQEALKAKKQLKDNSLAPALSTRSNDRNLRDRKQINYKV